MWALIGPQTHASKVDVGVGTHYPVPSRIDGGGLGLQEALRGMQDMKVRGQGEGQAVLRTRDQVGKTLHSRLCLFATHNLYLMTPINPDYAYT